ncbi:hypothetical protein IFO70_32165 [Phormidium tenue FACHB-886]|nr:hypothetical protein [Phormidium tenue FACHB-886]
MKIQFTKHGGKQDWMKCICDDGTFTRCPMPKQGILPHDFVHYVVEDTLNLKRGFYSILAIGVGFPQSAPPWDAAEFEVGDLTEALQAESFVKWLPSQREFLGDFTNHLWSTQRHRAKSHYKR